MDLIRRVIGLSLLKQNKNKKNQIQHTNVELDFLNYFYDYFKKELPNSKLKYNILEDYTLEFFVGDSKIGIIRLRGSNKGMQVYNNKEKWFVIKEKEDYFTARNKLKEWLDYYKQNIN